ncbi:hypothetical protein [Lacticaseibacillus suibinensis]|uniref:hypothetical protein n=1 Tax=Lacticaseibacillus suibinensis TaxID=2486011 RepID=UPI000F77E2CC|nr:hypothetical protein [Lacticaseibacillus suibinensis]
MRGKYTGVSRGWLGLFSLIYTVLLIVFGVGLSFALTFGRETQMRRALTNSASLTSFQQTITASAVKVATGADIPVVPQGNLVTKKMLARGLRTGLAVSANFGQVPQKSKAIDWAFISTNPDSASKLTLAPMLKEIDQRTAASLSKQGQAYPAAIRTQVKAAVQEHFNQVILDTMMAHGIGLAYPMFALFTQTAAIVGGILAVIVLLVMRAVSHSWSRWLRVSGRITYLIALLAGLGALLAAVPAFAPYIKLSGVGTPVILQMQAQFVPVWQHVAGIVAIVGLVMAGLGQLLRLREKRTPASN